MENLFNKLLIPFAILRIRLIQYRYKKITINNPHGHTNRNISVLILLQAKERYYNEQFSAWGKYHPEFSFSGGQMRRHIKFMNWLFPEKDFKEWEIVVWRKSEAITYYQNLIYKLSKGVTPIYEIDILRQIKKRKIKREKNYL